MPLIIYLVTDKSDHFTRDHASEALNFQITVLIVSFGAFFVAVLAAIATAGLGLFVVFPALLAVIVLEIVWCIQGALAASRRAIWRYPVSIRMVK
jgi:hypothetical protein